MDVLLLLYTVLPAIVAVYGVAVYLAPRRFSVAFFWIIALIFGTVLVLSAIIVMRKASGGAIPLASMLKAYATLYVVPLGAFTAFALHLRARRDARFVALVVTLLVAVGITIGARYASGYFLDFVNASD